MNADAFGWGNPPSCPSTWAGVDCDGGRVVRIEFNCPHEDDGATIPLQMANLTALTNLSMNSCAFKGRIPNIFNLMTSLSQLSLVQNQLESPLPQSLLSLTALTSLNLQGNQLSGTVPDFSNMRHLVYLNLAANLIRDEFPDLRSNGNLTHLILANNSFYGTVLAENFDFLLQLDVLDLRNNYFGGLLHQEITSVLREAAPISIYLSNNFFEGDAAVDFTQAFTGAWADNSSLVCDITQNLFWNCPPTFAKCCTGYTNTTNKNPNSGTTIITTSASTSSTTSTTTSASSSSLQLSSATSASSITSSQTVSSSSSATSTRPTTTKFTTSTTSASTTSGGFDEQCTSLLQPIAASSSLLCDKGTWRIKGSASNSGTVTIASADTVEIEESFTQTEQGSLVIYSNTSREVAVAVGGELRLGGSFVFVVTSPIDENTTFTVMNASTIVGSFDKVEVVVGYSKRKCEQLQGTPSTSGASILMQVSSSRKCAKKSSAPLAIGVAVGLSGLIIISAIIIAILVYLKNRGKMGSLFTTQSKSDMRDAM